MAGGGKNKLEYVKQQEPRFLREFKARTNFKEGPTVETKKQKSVIKLTESDDDGEDREDEKPVICVLKDGDLTEEDYENYRKNKKEDDDTSHAEGKIMFKKPAKRSIEGASNRKEKEKEAKKSKKSDNRSLLSFDDEEDC